jgi:branched-chain amino acid transport system permease protein
MVANAARSSPAMLRAGATLDIPEILKTAALAAVVTFLLAVSIVGIETISSTADLTFATRYTEVFIAVVGVFFGSIAISLMRAGYPMPAFIGAGVVTIALLAALVLEAEHEFFRALLPFRSIAIDWGAVVIPAVIAARAAQLAWRARRKAAGTEAPTAIGGALADFGRRAVPWIGIVLIVCAIALPWLPLGASQRKVIDICTLVLTYIMLGWGLNIVVGLAGLLDLGYVAFYAVGAYSYAMLAANFGWSFWICLPLAGVFAASFGILLGFPVLRLRGDYLAIVTLGFGEMIRIILINWWWVTGGPNGINKVARPSFFGFSFERKAPDGGTTVYDLFGSIFGTEFSYNPYWRIVFLYYLILACALVTNFFTLRIRKLPLGRAWEALREDETACRALGINPTNTKLTAFAVGAMFAGFAGSFFGARQGFVSPESFVFLESAVILAIVVLGGLGSQVGIVLAAAVLIGVPELFRELKDYRMLAFGIGMVMIMIWKPGGLLAHRDPTIRLSGATAKPGAGP